MFARETVSQRRVAAGLALWGFVYAAYRAYYAVGGEFGMIGEPRSAARLRTVNAAGAVIISFAAVLPLIVVRRPALRRFVLPVLGWFAAVGCCMHALVDGILRLLSVTGAHPTQLPSTVWRTFDRHAADVQDLALNEPWFMVEGVLWAALALTGSAPGRRRTWTISAGCACAVLTTLGVLSGVGAIGAFHLG